MITARLALLRHGHTAWNRAGRIQGRTDEPLDNEARQHLATLVLPAECAHAHLVASPLARAVQTARILGGREPTVAPELIEMDWGRWEGRRGVDLLADAGSGYRHIEDWGWDFRPPGGESPADVRARLQPLLENIEGDALVVTHIGIMRVLLALATHWNFRGTPPFTIKRDRLYRLDVHDGRTLSHDGDPVRLAIRSNP